MGTTTPSSSEPTAPVTTNTGSSGTNTEQNGQSQVTLFPILNLRCL
ncbi:hypothetical protein A2U01_0088462, partial [Trifolium medium]|nr:hypothetical protein [Trifolium medium]